MSTLDFCPVVLVADKPARTIEIFKEGKYVGCLTNYNGSEVWRISDKTDCSVFNPGDLFTLAGKISALNYED